MPPYCANCNTRFSCGNTWDHKPLCLPCAERLNFTLRGYDGRMIYDGSVEAMNQRNRISNGPEQCDNHTESFPLIDFTFGVGETALKMLQIIDNATVSGPNVMRVETTAYYNGRERLACITVTLKKPFMYQLAVVSGGDRSSDLSRITQWEQDASINPPQPADTRTLSARDQAYKMSHYYTLANIDAAVLAVLTIIRNFASKEWKNV